MILTASQMYGINVQAADRPAGRIDDLLFDDRSWGVTHMVVSMGRGPLRRRVQVSTGEIASTDWAGGRIGLCLSYDQVAASVRLEANPPVALQKRQETLRFLAWDAYWTGVFDNLAGDNPHLRNTRAVTGHHALAMDREVGFVENFVVDDRQWVIRYLVIRMGRSPDTRRVMIEPRWVDAIDWEERGVAIHLAKAEVEHCREFHPEYWNAKCERIA